MCCQIGKNALPPRVLVGFGHCVWKWGQLGIDIETRCDDVDDGENQEGHGKVRYLTAGKWMPEASLSVTDSCTLNGWPRFK